MKKINLFVFSEKGSIDRIKFENFINRQSREFKKNFDLEINITREDQIDPINDKESFVQLVKASDVCVFIVFASVDKKIVDCYHIAKDVFFASSNDMPKIFTFFKDDVEADQSVLEFQDELMHVSQHYFNKFSHIDTVNLKVFLHVIEQHFDLKDVSSVDGKCVFANNEIIELDNVSQFANNEYLSNLKKQYEEIQKEYLKIKNTADISDENYISLCSKRNAVLKAISDHQKRIFDVTLRICKDENGKEISQKQREAYDLFVAGKLEEALFVLDHDAIKSDYEREMLSLEIEEMNIKNAKKRISSLYISEIRSRIELLFVAINRKDRFDEIEKLYDEIVVIAENYKIEIDVIFDYANFLHNQNKSAVNYYQKAIRLYEEKLQESETQDDIDQYASCLSVIYSNVAVCLNEINDSQAEEYCIKAIESWKKYSNKDAIYYNTYLANYYNTLGTIYSANGKYKKALECYVEAVKIIGAVNANMSIMDCSTMSTCLINCGNIYSQHNKPKLAENAFLEAISINELISKNDDSYLVNLFSAYYSFAIFLFHQKRFDEARDYFDKAIATGKDIENKNPKLGIKSLVECYSAIANFYSDIDQIPDAEKYFKLAIQYFELLFSENPDKYIEDLILEYNNYGRFCYDNKKYDDAVKYYNLAIKLINNSQKEHKDKLLYASAFVCCNFGMLCSDIDQKEDAEYYLKRACAIREKLVKEDPSRHSADLAECYCDIGNHYLKYDQNASQEYYKKAIKIYKKLVATNPNRYSSSLAMCYNNLANALINIGKTDDAKSYFMRSLDIRKRMYKQNPDIYKSDLAMSYNNLGAFYFQLGEAYFKQASDFFKKAIPLYEDLAKECFEKYAVLLAVVYYHYGAITKNADYLMKAYVISKSNMYDERCREIVGIFESLQ